LQHPIHLLCIQANPPVHSGGGDICLGYATLKYIFPNSDQWKPGPLYAGKGGVSFDSFLSISSSPSFVLLESDLLLCDRFAHSLACVPVRDLAGQRGGPL
jgi:hypothetical protein